MTLCDGEPGTGKTTLLMDIAARVTTGRPMFECDGGGAPGGVVLIPAEDDLGSVIVPRLRVAGANLKLVRAYDRSALQGRQLRIPDDIDWIERELGEVNGKLLIFDPFTAFVSGNVHCDQSARKALAPLVSLAERSHTAVVLVRHQTKGNGRALHRGSGSIGVAAARSGLMVASAPGDPDLKILSQYKSNYGPPARSLAFRIEAINGVPRIDWIGESQLRADDLITSSTDNDPSALQEAVYVLFSLLAKGPISANAAKKGALDTGVTSAILRNAKKALGIKSRREGFGPGSQFFWELPPQNELLKRLRDNEMQNLMDKLCHDSDDDDPANWWKSDGKPDDGDGGAPIVTPPKY